jgi:hypothetical protein
MTPKLAQLFAIAYVIEKRKATEPKAVYLTDKEKENFKPKPAEWRQKYFWIN